MLLAFNQELQKDRMKHLKTFSDGVGRIVTDPGKQTKAEQTKQTKTINGPHVRMSARYFGFQTHSFICVVSPELRFHTNW